MQTPDTPEDKVRATLFAGLKEVIPTLKPGDIQIEEQTYDPHTTEAQFSLRQVKEYLGSTATIGVNTNIIINSPNMGIAALEKLQAIIYDLTGQWCTYSNKAVTFKGTTNGLSQLLERADFVRLVKERMQPLGRGAA